MKNMTKQSSFTLAGILHGVQNAILERSFRNSGVHRMIGQNFGRGLAHAPVADEGVIHAGTKAFLDKRPELHAKLKDIAGRLDPQGKILPKIKEKLKGMDSYISGATVPELQEMSYGAYELGNRARKNLGQEYRFSKRDAVIGRALERGDFGKAFKLHNRSEAGRAVVGEAEKYMGVKPGTLHDVSWFTPRSAKARRPGAIGRLARIKVNKWMKESDNPLVKHLIPGSVPHIRQGAYAGEQMGVKAETNMVPEAKQMYRGAATSGVADPYLGGLNAFKSVFIDPRVVTPENPAHKVWADRLLDTTVHDPMKAMFHLGESGAPFPRVANKLKTAIVNPLSGRSEQLAFDVGKVSGDLGMPEYRRAYERSGISYKDYMLEKVHRHLLRFGNPHWKTRDDIR